VKVLRASGVVAGLAVAGAMLSAPVAQAAVPRSCDGGQPVATDTITAKSTTYGSIIIELRYSPAYACAWGRIRGGRIGDSVVVSRRWNGNPSDVEYDLGKATITSGSDVFTPWFDDDGHTMSACAENDSTQTVYACTGWY
jgi:hypothetical protein